MPLPAKAGAQALLESHVQDDYQRYHALMVATAMAGYAEHLGHDPHLWYVTGLLHDIDFEEHPDSHPTESLGWFKAWNYPEDLIHAVEAHAYSYNDFTTLPSTPLAAALLATDELCGIFYAYQKMNPIPFGEMKAKSIKKKIKDHGFAAKVDRATIFTGCEHLGIDLDEHVNNLIRFLGELPH
jgi:putative nucleotidyltransferase with HDIG domain